jgi:hypothetical protein
VIQYIGDEAMKIFKHHIFQQWMHAEGLTDETLRKAINEIEKGLYETNLGSGLYKKRIAREGQGKRGSYRTLIAFKQAEKAFFIYGFAKNIRDNISTREKKLYRRLAKDLLSLNAGTLQKMLANHKLFEVK